jgi:serine/threonine protein kinase/tetratricopeptide (TPR) repeat protein
MIGESVSHYRVIESLGRGGMGEVYLAEDLRLHRLVALKMCPAEDEAAASLLREARVASVLNHPGIAVIYEIGDADRPGGRQSFIAMEYVKGKTLAEFAHTPDLGLEEIVDVVGHAAEALAAAHRQGVVHRDVKPSNVMVLENMRVKVLDFGLAKYVPLATGGGDTWSGRDLAISGSLMGTFSYMSPEQARGRDVDGRTDIFSLGVVLYELVTGHLPFSGENAVEIIDAILREDPPPMTRGGEAVSPGLERIVRRMLAKDPDFRYQSMQDVCGDLEEAKRSSFQGAAAVHLESPSVAVMTFANITKGSEDEWLGTGIAETVTADLKSIEGLRVISRERIHEMARKLSGAGAGGALATHLGREMDARLVVSGGYQRLGDVVRVTARVTETETGAVLRTIKIDGKMSEIFGLQDRIVAELSEALKLSLRPALQGTEETQVLDAYESFAKGLINLRAESTDSLDRAILFFQRAVELDPGYAKAYLQLGVAQGVKAGYLVLAELHEKALANFRKALDLRPSFAEAWRETGLTLNYLGREDEAIHAIERALALDPVDSESHAALGRAYFIGKADFTRAASAYERALALNPRAGWSALQLSHCAALLRKFQRGEEAARRAVVLQEEFLSGKEGFVIVGAHIRLGHLAALQGRHAEAKEHFEREMEFLRRVDHALKARVFIELHMRVGSAEAGLGNRSAADAALGIAIEAFERRVRMGTDDPFTRYYAAGAYALKRETDLALASLEKAIQMRPAFTIARARIEPDFDTLRETSRFRELISAPRSP